ncbi:MAG: hypothetical protein ACRDHN_21135 [Thermomicrobiales bacterium]
MSESGIRRYERPREDGTARRERVIPIPAAGVNAAIAGSTLTPGAKALARGLIDLGSIRSFSGGGLGIEYGSLLKTAVRPDIIGEHVREAGAHLRENAVDILLVPGMSGFPIGSMYAFSADLPAVLLKKNEIRVDRPFAYSPGAFVIPSYTGEGDVVMTADPKGVQDIVDRVLNLQLEQQRDAPDLHFTLRFGGADDIIDKATMSQAVSESASVIGEVAIETFVSHHRERTGDTRRTHSHVEVVAWVTPMIKTYTNPPGHLLRTLGLVPFTGLEITGIQNDPPALGIEGIGMVALRG